MKHRWRLDMNWLSGVRLSRWRALLRSDGVDPVYWHRAALLTALSAYNSGMARVDGLGSTVDHAAMPIKQPLFILGHWRSGTTWLYHLLATDPALAAPNAFQVVNPTTFLRTEAVSSRIFGLLIPNKRVQDDVPLGFDTPEEDEYAIGLLSGCSPYLGRSFPSRLAHYERFLTLNDATDTERAAFRDAMRDFLGRLTQKTGRALVLKSPAHTARVRHLLRWFPDARFIHIHRDPYTVFQSTRRLYDTVDWYWTLQRRPGADDATILRQYRLLHEAWFADRDLIPPDRLVEIPYESLRANPLGELERTYAHLGMNFTAAKPSFERQLAAQPDYQQNRHPALSDADRDAVRRVAGPCFDAWGYPR